MSADGDQGPIVPPATIGMFGGGQLGKYALAAANAMGYRTVVLDPDHGAPAAVVANDHLVAPYDEPAALARLEQLADIVTTEFENPPADALERLALTTPVRPGADAVRIAQNRIAEKAFLVEHGFPVGGHLAVPTGTLPNDDELRTVASAGAVVKAARLGYDGKGQRRVDGPDAVAEAIAELGGVDVVVESLLDLRSELSVLVARDVGGRVRTWPVAGNEHVDGILDVSVVPAPIEPDVAAEATDLAVAIVESLDYRGVLAVEMFVVDDADGAPMLLVNELAPRPHNSGHWTIDAAATSQFEQQIRAVCGVGLGSTDLVAPAAAMVNILGDLWFSENGDRREPAWEHVLAHHDARLHLYGKAEPRPGRKMGHLTVTGPSPAAARELALHLRDQLTRPHPDHTAIS